jgi:hypothetical protein
MSRRTYDMTFNRALFSFFPPFCDNLGWIGLQREHIRQSSESGAFVFDGDAGRNSRRG